MPITINNSCVHKTNFDDEYELQAYLEKYPYLLMNDTDAKVTSVQREVTLPCAGNLDLLLVDANGCPIAVEVKLARNGQSRREVVAQAFDYVSDLSQLTVDELDNIVGGALLRALNEFPTANTLWKTCATNLRAGLIKVIIAVDKANEGLIRIVRYINDHSDLDVRLVEISKYDNGSILIPNILVDNANSVYKKFNTIENSTNEEFEKIIKAYNSYVPENLRTVNKAKSYRQIFINGWPKTIHYEILDYSHSNQVSIELHLEGDNVSYLRDSLISFDNKKIGNEKIEWDSKWSKKRGRIFMALPFDDDIEKNISMFKEFIDFTYQEINRKLTKN
jgi:hypothetical protein